MALKKTFKDLVAEAKSHISEIDGDELAERFDSSDDKPVVIDVREAADYAASHIQGAVHISRGILELDIDEAVPDTDSEIVCYCGGGSRSALATQTLQAMGYTNVRSLKDGFRGWKDAGRTIKEA